ncbi:MAG: hypothetical protein J6V21_06440 [Alistipes sp.]|nr:hypothetical protein [Alistipes sp.]
MRRFLLLLLAMLQIGVVSSLACTSAIVSASRSSEGAPLLWKHRDSSFSNTRVEYVEGGVYAYTAIVPNTKRWRTIVYAGINEAGLGVITTATKHLPKATPEEWEACSRERVKGSLSCRALRNCATVDEFEEMLKNEKRARGFTSNLGIADASGAVAYFEIWDLGYCRYDVDERGKGFDVRANFSHAGNPDKKGASERRYSLIMREMQSYEGCFEPRHFIEYSRSYNSVKYGDVLASNERYVCSNYTVPRATTVGAFVIVCDGKNPRMLVMNGHSVSSLAVPVYVQAKGQIPQCVRGSAMRRLSEDFRQKAYRGVANNLNILNKPLVRKVLKIKHPKVSMPMTMPDDIRAFNAAIDKQFAKHERRVRRVLAKF